MRAVGAEHVSKLSLSLIDELAETMQTSADNFTFELIATEYFERGQPSPGYPFIEVYWFARSQEIQDLSAKIITEQIRALTKARDISVVFHTLNPKGYYDNGTHF